MAFQKLAIPLILTLYCALLASASSLRRRQNCIVNPILYTSFDETLTLSVQNKSHPLHNRAIYYTPLGDSTTGPVEHALTVYRSSPLPPAAFRLTSQKLYHAPPLGVPEQIPVYTRPSGYSGLDEVYFPATLPSEEPKVLWSGYPGCDPDTNAPQLELGPDGNMKVCAKPQGDDWRIYVQSGSGQVEDCVLSVIKLVKNPT
ncbi:unnamed protein product [Tuber melanosporum]|jgi:hypothetical protein|uniref:(Perigord truffle) hypothetical protein n=1 Tax=Tuber melanosporum (strain Mel28) TaxID=656061 RepID=D5GAH8_TUBMM|nr:uncharacterized protein GSTUM_00003593001 [Tuber melanosporum]CAZ81521.1 unnamed protein product [Tuber melanosporum]